MEAPPGGIASNLTGHLGLVVPSHAKLPTTPLTPKVVVGITAARACSICLLLSSLRRLDMVEDGYPS
ncbi:unnamed protein product [Aspergillus oryzae]|nr:unnamed protein product [Aspergillus oryzae]